MIFVFYCLAIPIIHQLIRLTNRKVTNLSANFFLKQTLLPAIFILLPAIMYTYYLTGNLTFFSKHLTLGALEVNPIIGGGLLMAFLVGFAMNSVFPFHTWLPRTYPTPAPVSTVIHTVAGVKTASIAIVKIVVYIFGLDYVRELSSHLFTGGYIVYICGITAVVTAYKALKTDDLKQRFSYSTVGQLSYIILAILIGTKTGIMAATLHVFTHSIAKGTLFYVAGFVNTAYGTTSARRVSKLMPSHKFIAFVVAICGASITGFPFLAGYYSKDLMLIEEWHTGNYASSFFLLLGSFINILYIYPVVRAAFNPVDTTLEIKPIPKMMLAVFIISVLLIFGSNFYITYLTHIIE
jgi:multicomponent Na+:H+ antiporter subunit D